MEKILVGRLREKAILDSLFSSAGSQLVAILGRRRVGKTYLVRMHCSSRMVFECSGTIDGSTASQLVNFAQRLKMHFKVKLQAPPANWQQAFVLLEESLVTVKSGEKSNVLR